LFVDTAGGVECAAPEFAGAIAAGPVIGRGGAVAGAGGGAVATEGGATDGEAGDGEIVSPGAVCARAPWAPPMTPRVSAIATILIIGRLLKRTANGEARNGQGFPPPALPRLILLPAALVASALGFASGVFRRILGTADRVLDLAFGFLDLALDFHLLVAENLACLFLDAADGFLGSTADAILVHDRLLRDCGAVDRTSP
jgi:hypothetical protein